jgi:hypothetical protein
MFATRVIYQGGMPADMEEIFRSIGRRTYLLRKLALCFLFCGFSFILKLRYLPTMGAQWERTEEQQAYLDSVLPKYLQAQADGKGTVYILVVIEEWFKRWPESDRLFKPSDPPLTEEEKAMWKSLIASAVAKRRKVYLSRIANNKLTNFNSNC